MFIGTENRRKVEGHIRQVIYRFFQGSIYGIIQERMFRILSVKTKILAAFTGLALCASTSVFAVYPMGQQMQYPPTGQQVIYRPQQVIYQQPGNTYQQPNVQQYRQVQNNGYIPTNRVAQMPQAVAPGRITGALPKVGSSYVDAGRKYYNPEGFDRLADSGLYVGLSIGYTYSITGGLSAEYAGQPKAWYVPGAFQEAAFTHESVMPIQISVGAAINNDLRVDFSYLRYSGISYPGTVMTSDGVGGFIAAQATDGRVSSTATMLNLYYNLDSYTGVLASGSLRPYIGVGLGIGMNTISDYLIYDASFYPEIAEGMPSEMGKLTAISDVYAYHSGGTTEQIAFAIEGGVTTELEGGLKLDFFVRWANLGRVESSGSIVVSQTEWLGTGVGYIGEDTAEEPAGYDSVFHYTNWKESGTLTAVDLGIRMRIQF